MKIRVIYNILALLFFSMVFPQDLQKVVPPSPTASALAQYSNVPVSHYTGVPNISVPLYNIKSGEIELPITLSYHSSGIKVSQEASSVGLGWSLSTGGVITRSVNGVDDLAPVNGYVFINDLSSTAADLPVDIIGDHHNYADTFRGVRDGQPDLLYYNFLGESGKMIFGKKQAGSNRIECIPIKQTNSKFVYDIVKKEWEVTDGNGWKYFFNVEEISRNYSSGDFDSSDYASVGYTQDGVYLYNLNRLDIAQNRLSNFNRFTSAWYINKIITPKGDSIIFQYDKESGYRSITQMNYYERESNYAELGFTETMYSNLWHGYLTENKRNISASMQFSENVNIKKIFFNGGYINFSTSDREDLRQHYQTVYYPKAQKIQSFEVFNLNSKSIKKVEFNYSYFNAERTGTNKENYWRLKLDNVQELFYDTASNSYSKLPPYTFTYNSTKLPAKTSPSIDHWGYYNGIDNDNVLIYKDLSSQLFDYYGEYSFASNPVIVQTPTTISTSKFFRPLQIECAKSTRNTWFPFLNGAYREPDANFMKASMLTEMKYPTGGGVRFDYEPNSYEPPTDVDFRRSEAKKLYLYHEGFGDADIKDFTLNYHSIVKIACNISDNSTSNEVRKIDLLIETSSGTDVIRFSPTSVPGNGFRANVQLVLPPGNYRAYAKTNASTSMVEVNMSVEFIQQYPVFNKIGDGLRVKSQEMFESSGEILKKRIYKYNHQGTDDWTSGMAMGEVQHFYRYNVGSFPTAIYSVIGNYARPFTEEAMSRVIIGSSGTSVPLSSSAQGNFVGYSSVSVSDVDKLGNSLGRSVYYYTNRPDEKGIIKFQGVPLMPNNSNGDLITEEDYNKNGVLIRRKEIEYKKEDPSTILTKGIFTGNIPKSYNNDPDPGIFYTGFYRIYSEWSHQKNSIETIYDLNGANPVTSIINYDYENYLHKNLTKTTTTNSKGQAVISQNKYPQDLPNGIDETSASNISSMVAANVLNTVIQSETTVAGSLTQGTINNIDVKSYLDENNISKNMHLPKNLKTIKGGSAGIYDKKIDFVSYGKYGNLTEYKQADGITTVYLWGYKEQYPVAEVKNSSLSAVEAVFTPLELSNIKNGTYDQASMVTILNKIRTNLPNAMVTTYTYIPLVGVSTITDPKGYTTTYTYDSFGRLESVKDNKGFILSENQYNYKH
ncbi:RHS repeat domain-containing protein [Flavobacterium sp. 3-218]